MKNSQQSIQAAKEVPLVDIIHQYVELKPNGRGYVGLCPFHDERTPSFSILPGICYKCFGCGEKGNNPVDFIMKHDKLPFQEAVNKVLTLAGLSNIEFNEWTKKTFSKNKEKSRDLSNFSTVPKDLFKKSLQLDKNVIQIAKSNKFIKYLLKLFGPKITINLISKYFIGTSNHIFTDKAYPGYKSDSGSTIFWQKDIHGKVRTGKIMLYDSDSGKRLKEPFNHITMVHSKLRQTGFKLKQCLYGEHLLKNNSKPVALVESEKTAIIASIYFPRFTWLAVGGKENLNLKNCKVLKGRNVILFPDLNAFESWSEKAIEFSSIGYFQVNDCLEKKSIEFANENNIELSKLKKAGFDLADLLINYDHRKVNIQ